MTRPIDGKGMAQCIKGVRKMHPLLGISMIVHVLHSVLIMIPLHVILLWCVSLMVIHNHFGLLESL